MYLKDQSRAMRRNHVARLKKTRKGYWGMTPEDQTERRLGGVVQYPCVCSCWMCGNARKWQGEQTIQERRAMQVID